MKTFKIISIAMAASAVLSCAVDDIPEVVPEGSIPLNIESSITQVHTKATAQGFVNGDGLGLYAVNYTADNTQAGTLVAEGNQADNVKYVFDEQNWKWNPVRPVYYKNVNTNVDLYLYYPHQSDINDVNAFNFQVQKDQSKAASESALSGYEASDFLWGKAVNVVPTESKVKVQLNHKLASAKVILAEGTGFGEGEFDNVSKSVILSNTTRKATINFSTGVVTAVGNPQYDGIVMCPQDDGSWRAVVVPQTVAAGTQSFSITLDGVSYSFTNSEKSISYTEGKMVSVTIRLNKKSPAGDYELELADAQITDWTEDRNTHGGEARQYYVVNVETPGTLGKTIKAAGKNPDKIKNLKVVGTVNDFDFSFMRDSMSILESINMKESILETFGQSLAWRRGKLEDMSDLINQYGYPDRIVDGEFFYWNEKISAIPGGAFQGKTSLFYFEFPEETTSIGGLAFASSNLSGALIIPNNVTSIGGSAFQGTRITSIQFSDKLVSIEMHAFYDCSALSGNLVFPATLTSIGYMAFCNCSFSGHLHLPDNLEELGASSFKKSGHFEGDLIIPEKITTIKEHSFDNTSFTGSLILNNVTSLEQWSFNSSKFKGELIIPEGIQTIPDFCFSNNNFTSVLFPQTLRIIRESAFQGCVRLMEISSLPDGFITIGFRAFDGCRNISKLILPSSMQSIEGMAFNDCFNLSSIISNSSEPPTIQSAAFDGVAKDNFTVEVPAQSVKRYRSESGWSDFKRIAAHYDFSISRERMRLLNGAKEKTYILRAPAGFDWSVTEKPDWLTVTPTSGTGKTEVTISVSEMPRISTTFEVNEGTYNKPSYKNYKGRAGEVVFTLTEKDYSCSIDIEQYDSDYSDGEVKTYQTASKGNGIDIVFIGDGYDAKDIAKGTFLTNAEDGYNHLFDVEPYKTYKEYFNVKAVISMSDESGFGTVNTIIDNKFGSCFTQNRILCPSAEPCFTWAKKANPSMDLTKSLTILMMNTSTYEGITMMYGDGSAIACCPVSTEAYPYDYRGLIQHEAGGHGFGKLGDEYIYHNAFIQTCSCPCCEHPTGDNNTGSTYGQFKSRGWFKNLSMSSDPNTVPWAHLLYNPQYSDYVDIYEGGYMHTRGVFRSEATSCMNNNIPYYSAISRQAIVERIMQCAGEEFSLEQFYAKDDDSFGPTSRSASWTADRNFGVDPLWSRGSEHGSVVYMGEHPAIR